MNKYDQMLAVMNLSKAQVVVDSLAKNGRWLNETLTMNELVALQIAVADALKVLNEDLLARIDN